MKCHLMSACRPVHPSCSPTLWSLAFIFGGAVLPAQEASPTDPAPQTEINYQLAREGRFVYESHCVTCHGPRGDGKGELAKDLPIKPRSFKEGWFKFRSTPYDKLPTEDDLRRTITGGLSGTAMGMFNQLTEAEVTALIEYVRSLSRRWRKEENYAPPLTFPEPPAWVQNEKLVKDHAAQGRTTFLTVCAACHGEKGDGSGPAGQALKDGWDQPIKPADLRQPHLRCGDAPSDIFRILTTGMTGTPMLSFASTLSEEQRWDLAAYVVSLRPAASAGDAAAPASSSDSSQPKSDPSP